MIAAVAPGKRPGGMTDLLVAKLLGRTLAHELGHVLLNSQDHDIDGTATAIALSCTGLTARSTARLHAQRPTARRSAHCSRTTPSILASGDVKATLQCGHLPCMVTYRFGPYLLTPDQRRVERDGAAVPLTPKAFDLLVTLVRHRSRALSKDEIMTLVWPETQVEEGNLAQQVLLLRRALSDAGEVWPTLPKHGYRFVAPIVEEHGETAAPPTSPHVLVWDGREFPLREGVTVIGRAEDADLRIPLPSVSRQHARIVRRRARGDARRPRQPSRLVAGHDARAGAVPLTSGDEIRLGTATLVYVLAMPDDSTRK